MKGKVRAVVTDGPPPSRYLCEICGKTWVVPSLARFCEERHLSEE